MCYNCSKCDGSGYYGNSKKLCPLVRKPKDKIKVETFNNKNKGEKNEER
jgi:hypothetical protein